MSDPLPGCPYKGLEPYEEPELAYFFGREEDAQRIANALMTAPLTVLYGRSGIGKSSVLQTAVPPLLRDPENTLVLLWNAWQSPGFLESLLDAAFEEANVERPRDATLDRALPALVKGLDRPVALIFDQFEEYFHYHDGSRDAFEQQLARLVNRGPEDIHVLLSLRDDGLASLDRLRPRIPQILRYRLELKHLGENGAKEAIEGPLRKFNEVHGTKIGIAERLRDRIIAEVSTRDPDGNLLVETAYLQLAMTKLWEKSGGAGAKALYAKTFDRLGGADRIARQHLEDVLERLSPAERNLAADLFDRLVTPGGGKVALSANALAGYAKTDLSTVESLLQRLTRPENRLLRPVPSPNAKDGLGFELFHDVLGMPARAWLKAEADRHAWEVGVAEAKAKEIRRKRTRLYGITAAIVVFFLVLTFGYSYIQILRIDDLLSNTASNIETAKTNISNLNVPGDTKIIEELQQITEQIRKAQTTSQISSNVVGSAGRLATEIERTSSTSQEQEQPAEEVSDMSNFFGSLPQYLWLLLLVFLLWRFRGEIGDLFRRVTGLKALGVELAFAKESLDEAVKARPSFIKLESGPKADPTHQVKVPEQDQKRALERAEKNLDLLAGKRILWADDFPSNNRNERRMFRGLGVASEAELSTENALERLGRDESQFDLILSDMKRGEDVEAGKKLVRDYAMLVEKQGRAPDDRLPIIFYIGNYNPSGGVPAGAFGITNRPDQLLHLVINALAQTRN